MWRLLALTLFLCSCTDDDESLTETRSTNLQTTVVSILQQNCYECHAADSEADTTFKSADNIDLMISEGIMIVDDAQNSPIFLRVTAEDSTVMPPSPADPLTDAQIEHLRNYIDTLDGQ